MGDLSVSLTAETFFEIWAWWGAGWQNLDAIFHIVTGVGGTNVSVQYRDQLNYVIREDDIIGSRLDGPQYLIASV